MSEETENQQAPQGEDKRTAADWAHAKGLLPQLQETSVGPRQNPGYWKYAAAQAHRRWTDTDLVTEADFDAAVAESSSQINR